MHIQTAHSIHPFSPNLILLPIINWFDLGLQLKITLSNRTTQIIQKIGDVKCFLLSAWLGIDPDGSYNQWMLFTTWDTTIYVYKHIVCTGCSLACKDT